MTNVKELAKEIAKQMEIYSSKVEKKVRNAENKVTRGAIEEIVSKSPRSQDGGEYAAGWTRKRTERGIIIYNKNKPSITHLLENGFALRNGDRKSGRPHIRPAEETAVKKFTELVEKAVKQ